MNIRWTTEAAGCLEQIAQSIAETNRPTAAKTVAKVFERIEQLLVFPDLNRPGFTGGVLI